MFSCNVFQFCSCNNAAFWEVTSVRWQIDGAIPDAIAGNADADVDGAI